MALIETKSPHPLSNYPPPKLFEASAAVTPKPYEASAAERQEATNTTKEPKMLNKNRPNRHPPRRRTSNPKWGYLEAETVFQCHKSSMLAGLHLEGEGRSQYPNAILQPDEYVLHGGAYPIRVKGVGLVAAVGISGLPSIEDHELSKTAIAERLGMASIVLPR